jgi:NAD(P)-dependent dehydrogenase (short-subunit alcohol dehydrogenase family)
VEPQKKILITGAAGGLGLSAASLSIHRGWRVFATDIREPDSIPSDDGANYSFIPADVTSEESVSNAFRLISAQTDELDAIVHMAGVLQVGPLVEIPEDYLNQSLEVNLMGVFRVNKHFYPLLRQHQGRIIIISSETGRQTAAPFNGPYAISKHALEAYADALRRELSLLGIRVIKIQPGPVKSEMTRSGEQKFREAAEASVHFNRALSKGTTYLPGVYRKACEPDLVAHTVVKALESSRPRISYRVKHDMLRSWLDLLPARWSDKLVKNALGDS